MGTTPDSSGSKPKVSEQEILAAKRGDWTAKNNIARVFTPLITSLAQKKSEDIAIINTYIEAGKEGLYLAAKKYKKTITPAKFQLFALNYIQKAMYKLENGKPSFFAKLFSR